MRLLRGRCSQSGVLAVRAVAHRLAVAQAASAQIYRLAFGNDVAILIPNHDRIATDHVGPVAVAGSRTMT